ncbi:hypothetical protein CRE_08966 [Caenorhabditis remanei]|uniref:Uncharacterized protein n=1 Tax=Caenorhabditis remanei TaxID=31234 RepID=E3LII2_CAERE|nr:hypothetical protein CRE_08966 [Caenorhabditis remanei]
MKYYCEFIQLSNCNLFMKPDEVDKKSAKINYNFSKNSEDPYVGAIPQIMVISPREFTPRHASSIFNIQISETLENHTCSFFLSPNDRYM